MRLSPALSSCASNTELTNRLDCHWTACLEFLVPLEAGPDLEGEAESELLVETRSSAIVDTRHHCHGQPYHFWCTYLGISIPFDLLYGICYLNSILCFIADIPYYYLYSLFYYLSDTHYDSAWFGHTVTTSLTGFVTQCGTVRRTPGVCVQSCAYTGILPLTAANVANSRSCDLSGSVSSWVEAVFLCVCGRWGWWTWWTSRPLLSLQFSEVILCGESDFHRSSISGN